MRLVKNNVVKIKTDETAISYLKSMGYVEDPKIEVKQDVQEPVLGENQDQTDETSEVEGMSYDDLKALATEKGLEFSHNIKKVDLIGLIKEA